MRSLCNPGHWPADTAIFSRVSEILFLLSAKGLRFLTKLLHREGALLIGVEVAAHLLDGDRCVEVGGEADIHHPLPPPAAAAPCDSVPAAYPLGSASDVRELRLNQ